MRAVGLFTHGGPEVLQVVVHNIDGRNIGLVVEEIVDIVEEQIVVERVGRRPGILGTTVLQGRVTDLLDVEAIVVSSRLELAIGA